MEISGLQARVLIHDNPLMPHDIVQPSVLERICGQEALIYTTKLLESLKIPTALIVDTDQSDQSKRLPAAINTVLEHHHADTIKQIARPAAAADVHDLASTLALDTHNNILIMQGALPLVTAELIQALYKKHTLTGAVLSFVIAHNDDPGLIGYQAIEQSDYESGMIHAGMYIVQRSFLEAEKNVAYKKNASVTTFFAHLIQRASDQKLHTATVVAPFDTIRAMHSFQDAWAIEHIKRSALVTHWMRKGVRFSAPHTVHLDLDVTIGAGSSIDSHVQLFGSTTIGAHCQIHAFSSLDQVTLGDNSIVYSHSVMKKSSTGMHAQIGPFAHINGDNMIGDHATIGNFVEIKRSAIGTKTKVKHLSYLGDAQVGNEVNIGAGTITCNHDGFTKHATTIEDNAYIGTNTTLIAPITIGHDAFAAAGSTLTKNVPSYALALARSRQINKEGYVHVLREKKQKALMKPLQHASSSIDDDTPRAFIGAVKPTPENNSADRL